MAETQESPKLCNLQKIWDWNHELPDAVNTCVHHLIAAQTYQQPDLLAVHSWDGDLTYAELDALSSRLAIYLTDQGVGPEVLVPICFEKSIWTVVSLLAVLKANGVFILLDPSQPFARLKSIIRQTGVSFALSSIDYHETCKTLVDRVFAVGAGSISGLEYGPTTISSVTPHNAAYIIFTSGSTGEPKGVVIEHLQLSTSSIRSGEAMGFQSKPRVFQFASYAFDACILEIVTTLVFGGTVCIPSEWERKNGIVNAMRRMETTCALFTPSLLSNLDIATVRTLDTLILGGEAIPPSLIESWASKLRVILAYGPTECCVVCFVSDTSQHKPAHGEIGRPIGSRAWIVKQNNSNILAEIGDIGELLIEGPILARGYLNDIAKTNAHFIQDPVWMARCKTIQYPHRLYRTGDLAKYLEDGTVCYVGRVDSQVKIRGQRLELAEVEIELQRCLSQTNIMRLEHALVEAITPTNLQSSPILVAFLCLECPDSMGSLHWDRDDNLVLMTSAIERSRFSSFVAKLELNLQQALPAHAIPSFYIPLNEIALTISGKMDRKRLRKIAAQLTIKQLATFVDFDRGSSFARYQPTEIERHLQGLWADIFGTTPVAIKLNDNFISLGGDSVLAIRLVAAARLSGLDINVQTVLKHPVLFDMALATTRLDDLKEDDASIAPFRLLKDPQVASRMRHEASKQCAISEHLIEDIYPCSAMQSGLLALSMKDSGAYIIQLVYALPASLDVDRFKNAWDVIVTQNPILRTRFFENDLGLWQVVIKEPSQWQIITDKSMESLLAAEKKRRMCLGEVMSWYTLLCQSDPPKYSLIWNIHHSLIDGWSAEQIASSVEQEYFGRIAAPSRPFNTFIQHLSKLDEEKAGNFWRDQLVDAPAPAFPKLPSSSYRPDVSAVLECQVPLFTRQGVTTATMIQAAWILLVGLYSNNSDVVTCMTLNGRTTQLPGIENIVGPTITTVPFRSQYQLEELAIDFLQKIQNQNLEIIPFEQFGLQKIRRLNPGANISCDFRSLLIIQAALHTHTTSRELLLERKYTLSNLDCLLLMEAECSEGTINFRATFDNKVLHNAQIERIFQQLKHLLNELSSCSPFAKLSNLQKIYPSDMQQILQWNNVSNVPKEQRKCVHNLVKQRGENQPEAPAICAWDGELSYKDLDNYASRLAVYLQSHHNIGPESLVPICFEKSMWVAVAMLAVLKAGGACVPMDPNNPTKRSETIIQSLGASSANLILTSALHADRLSAIGPRALIVQALMFDNLPVDVYPPNATATPFNSAFVVFTSGSTGNPKGIVLEHRTFCSSALNFGSFIQLSSHSRVLQFAAHTFDICIGDIFATLIHGGCVCIPSEHDKMNNLSGAIRSFQANHVSLTATVASYLDPEDVPGLQILVVAGEPMTRIVIDRWADHVTLINMYGPAECAVYCIGKVGIKKDDDFSNIGKGVGAMVWIANLDDSNSLTPIGGLGELLIEGPNLARGYLDDETQTKSVFIEDPAWAKSSKLSSCRRFYKTGDLGFYNYDGSISFAGRNDGQIKIRGQRLEIGEVEYRLRECFSESIEAAVCMVTPNPGDKILAAFLVVGNKTDETTEAIVARSSTAFKQFQALISGVGSKLESILPSYMVPSVYIPINKLPLSVTGKINRKRLQSIASDLTSEELYNLRGIEVGESRQQPSGMEKRMQSLWKALLNASQIGTNDNFFRLGGDSLTAMRLVSMARKEGITMTVDQVFKYPILSDMAFTSCNESSNELLQIPPFSLIGEVDREQLCDEAVLQCGIYRDQIEDIYPCTPMQAIFMVSGIQAQLVFSIPRSLDLKIFRAALLSLVQSQVVLRTRLIRTATSLLQVVVNESGKVLEASSLNEYLQKDKEDIIDCGQRLQRYCIVESKDTDERYFVWSAQHSSYDAWSMGLFFKELEYIYLQGTSHDLPVKMNHFVKFVSQIDREAAGTFFRSYLAGAVTKPLFTIPSDSCGRYNNTLATRAIDLPEYQPSNITMAMMIEVAWALIITSTVGSSDVILGPALSGRNVPIPGIEDFIGPTLSRIPLRIYIDPLQRTQNLLRSLQELQSIMMPFETLEYNAIEELVPEAGVLFRDMVALNILPFFDPMNFGSDIGLKMLKSFLRFEYPFNITCELKESVLVLGIMSDKMVISDHQVEILMRRFEHTLLQVIGSHLNRDQTLGDIDLSAVPDSEWHCTRTPWDQSAVSQPFDK